MCCLPFRGFINTALRKNSTGVRSQNLARLWNQPLPPYSGAVYPGHVTSCYNGEFVIEHILMLLAAARVFFRSRSDTALEVLALRQQVAVLKRKRPRPPLNLLDRFFWAALQR